MLTIEALTRCRKDTPALTPQECAALLMQVPDWSVIQVDGMPVLERTVKFPDFAAALRFTNAVGALAEAADHHPALLTEWGKVRVQWWTHTIGGLHRNDFIMAARTSGVIAQSD